MKAKYKIGMLIETEDGFGVIESVITRTKGYSYEVTGVEGFFEESKIKNAYIPVKTRKTTKTLKTRKSKVVPAYNLDEEVRA